MGGERVGTERVVCPAITSRSSRDAGGRWSPRLEDGCAVVGHEEGADGCAGCRGHVRVFHVQALLGDISVR